MSSYDEVRNVVGDFLTREFAKNPIGMMGASSAYKRHTTDNLREQLNAHFDNVRSVVVKDTRIIVMLQSGMQTQTYAFLPDDLRHHLNLRAYGSRLPAALSKTSSNLYSEH